MNRTCKNCGTLLNGAYCHHCGQAASTNRLNFKYLLEDIRNGLLQFDHGLLYTLKELILRPGDCIRNFIKGKRVRYFKPISTLLLIATIYGIMKHYIETDLGLEVIDETGQSIMTWMENHYALTNLILLPISTFCSFVLFKKQGYNMAEHFVLNAYSASLQLCIHIFILPILFLFGYHGKPNFFVTYIVPTLDLFILGWCFTQFFNTIRITKTILLILLMQILRYMILLLLIALVYLILTYLKPTL
ncbi:DUF3667 domain-containing protein [Robertkochia solimangrovi]|uniref:DUF3667 domain-containing protein n=1 Tax=Robertkochia solimangrovi TaxID=2213046 RepID=UPI00117E00C3|nr:DUF3667 domain-containing protein [Robertkochia solimangrovi]TRZ42263.1 hypothetical protein DMZ48_14640 [Robertkochia solimangrovi]